MRKRNLPIPRNNARGRIMMVAMKDDAQELAGSLPPAPWFSTPSIISLFGCVGICILIQDATVGAAVT